MPVRIKIEIFLIIILWILILSFLLFKLYISVSSRKGLRAPFWAGIILLFLFLSVVSAYLLIPQFDPTKYSIKKITTKGNEIALTFDDGPGIYTESILDILKNHNIKATFFLSCNRVKVYPEIAKKIYNEGHTIGNHTMNHRKFIFLTYRETETEITECENMIENIVGVRPEYVRLPHGFRNIFLQSILKKYKLREVGWSRGVWDTDMPGVDVIVKRATENISPGDIILLHDGDAENPEFDRSQTVFALTEIINILHKKGFSFTTIDSRR